MYTHLKTISVHINNLKMISHFKQRAYMRALSNYSASLHFFPPVLLADIHALVDMVTSLFPKLIR